MNGAKIRVLIADDQVIVREGIRRILEGEEDITIAGMASTAPEVLLKVQELQPDVVLLDLNWHQDAHAMDDVIGRLHQESPATAIIVLTVYDQLIAAARKAGVDWAFSKEKVGKEELLRIIRTTTASPLSKDHLATTHPTRSTLMRILTNRFNEEELRTLCFELEVDYDGLPGRGKEGKVREFLEYLQRRNQIPSLAAYIRERRSDISWDESTGKDEISNSRKSNE